MNEDYEVVVGLEVHAELKTQSKIFCSCSTAFGSNLILRFVPAVLVFPECYPF